jgi:hypothetical protein
MFIIAVLVTAALVLFVIGTERYSRIGVSAATAAETDAQEAAEPAQREQRRPAA